MNMSDILTEKSGSILRVQLNRPAKKNAMTSAMYITLADLLNATAKDDQVRVVLWHGAGDSFSAGNDLADFMKNPPGPGESPQARLIQALINFEKALVPEFGSSYLLPLRFGHARAAELILLGKPFDASRAAELGLVTQVVPEEK